MRFIIVFIWLVRHGFCDHLWRHVEIDVNMMDLSSSSDMVKQIIEMPFINCGAYCDKADFCLSWCYEGNSCIMTDVIVSRLHVATTSLRRRCFTYLERDLATGSIITSSPVNPAYPTRVATNLVTGIYNRNSLQTCTGLQAISEGPWIMFDLGSIKTIREIRMTTQDYLYVADLPHGAEVRIGKSTPVSSGNFNDFKLIGTLPNPAVPKMTYKFPIKEKITGRYVTFQKLSSSENLALCYFMIL